MPDGVEVHHRLIAVIALVRDDLFQRLRLVDVGLRVFDLLGRGRRRFDDRRRVALVSALQGDRDNRARLEVHRMLGFVGQMRPAVFHLRDLRIRIVRVRPVLIRRLLLPLPIQPRQVLPRRRLDARGLREPRQKLLIGFRRVPPHDAAHRGVGFQRGRIDRDGLALEEPDLDQPLLHPGEHRAMRLHDRSGAASAKSSCDRGPPHGAPGARNCGPPTSRRPATRSRAPRRCLRSSRPATAGNTGPAANPAAP